MERGDDPVLHGARMVDPAVVTVIVICAAAPLLLLAALLGLGVRDCRKTKRRLPRPRPSKWDNITLPEPYWCWKWSYLPAKPKDDPALAAQNWRYN
jgi:hypothetical protein